MRKIVSRISKLSQQATSGEPAAREHISDDFFHRMFERDVYLHISEISVAMIGICLTGVSILQVDEDLEAANTYIDDLLAIDAFIFLIACSIAYWAIRVTTNTNRDVRKAGNIANVIFIIGTIVMAIVCAAIVLQADFSPN